jgi:lipopolysaccharide transport system permease protein
VKSYPAIGSKLVIEAGRAERHYWSDLWRYRELFYFLAWRDVLVRYKQTAVGVAWAVLRPLVTMTIMTVVFGRLAGFRAEGAAPYAIMVGIATLPWQLFASILSATAESVVSNGGLISKVYFPRLVVPGSAVVVGLVDFAISTALIVLLMLWYHVVPSWHLVFLPLFIVLALVAALGPGLLFTALNVKYRDVRMLIPFVVQFGLYLTPVGYSSSMVREKLGETAYLVYCLNPIVGAIDGFRWCVLGGDVQLHPLGFPLSLLIGIGLLAWGIGYFRRVERTFADMI